MCSNGDEISCRSINELRIREQSYERGDGSQLTCFSQLSDDVIFHFQIIRLPKQSDKVGVTSLIGGASDNTGSGIARRLVLKTGLNIVLACNIPKNSSMLEANAEKVLMQKLIYLGYTKPRI